MSQPLSSLQVIPSIVRQGVSLASFNTFRFDYKAQYFALVEDIESLKRAVHWAKENALPITVIGGGSNLLIRADISGLVLVNRLNGIERIIETQSDVTLRVASGENWHQFVSYAVGQGLCGIENLALIPGTVGAAPVQNIGAYGVEVKDVLARVQVLDLVRNECSWLDANDCGFGYRESHFKGKWRHHYIITAIEIHLSKEPNYILSYGGLQNQIHGEPSLQAVFDAVCAVRESKLPDPAKLANSGSFFKNPVVSILEHDALKARFPDLVSFPFEQGFKLAAGWLIDQAGWKGRKYKGVGVYDKQALVLVNYSETQSLPLLELEAQIKESVFNHYGVMLEREPVALPFSSTDEDSVS